MKTMKRKKIGGLVALLGIPVLILLFLEKFGQQHYSIPTNPQEAEGFSAVVPAEALGKSFQLPGHFIDYQGNSVSEDLLSGKSTIFYVLPQAFTDTAQRVLEKLVGVRDIFENQPEVQQLIVAVTNETDSLSALMQRYHSQKTWQFLADTAHQVLPYRILPPGITSAAVLLIDQNQRIRGYYNGMQEKEIDRLVVETRILLHDVE